MRALSSYRLHVAVSLFCSLATTELMSSSNPPYVFRRLLLLLVWLINLPESTADENSDPAGHLSGVKEGIPGIDASFDYLVVGGGNAGVTLAARLAEQIFTVALVEAEDFYETKYPLAKEKAKCVAGSTASNYMIYHRTKPTIGSMMRWADLVDGGKPINFTAPNDELRPANATVRYREEAYDKNSWPVELTYPDSVSSFPSWLKLGLESGGVGETVEFKSGSLSGSFYCPLTMRLADQTRSSSESAFFRSLPSSVYLQSLTLYKNTMGKRILFDQKRATGVVVSTTGSKYELSATHEVVISSGAFQSPQLLMVSGIGPTVILQEHGIVVVVVGLPGVGQNLWDQVFFGPTYQVDVETFNKQVHGHLVRVCRRTAFVGNFSDPITMQPKDGKQYASNMPVLMTPTLCGNVSMISADTNDLPVIHVNWLTTETDQQVVIAAFKRTCDIFHSEAMTPIVIGDEYFPGEEDQIDSQILGIIRDIAMAPWHASGTCKMGTRSNRLAALDTRARVTGIEGLRVVDASAFSFLPLAIPKRLSIDGDCKMGSPMTAPNHIPAILQSEHGATE
ncbi:uncharacterized protein BDW43DRAFT_301382 [Aspergillus alliaceus]|uniref:uncharacterized protein n=1 Tax=Petromyces alliaceus TaxID=209559 RepID=UPI0012A563B8|nr:uncharacterized protein BDW43DRAFT_301382 [Aspergillus alliaceus]KAB8231961.1 hypothetical protein BDW43DRAFT_301382 [Aspergillus alliaceus]